MKQLSVWVIVNTQISMTVVDVFLSEEKAKEQLGKGYMGKYEEIVKRKIPLTSESIAILTEFVRS